MQGTARSKGLAVKRSEYALRFFDRHDVERDHDPGVVTAHDDEVNGLAGAEVELLMRHIRCEVDEITGGHFRDEVELRSPAYLATLRDIQRNFVSLLESP